MNRKIPALFALLLCTPVLTAGQETGRRVLPTSAVPGLQAPIVHVPGQGRQVPGFVLNLPALNAVLPAQSNVPIQWGGGSPAWNVKLHLVDVVAWAGVATVATNLPNTGSHSWTFPSSLTCNRTYLFFIAEMNDQTWHYGPEFLLECPPTAYDIELTESMQGSNYGIKLTNPGVAIVGPATITVLDALPAGLGITGGQGHGPGWTMVPGAGTTGPAQITLTYTIPTGTTIAAGGLIGWYKIQTALQIQNCATAHQLTVNSTVVAETNLTNNTDCVP